MEEQEQDLPWWTEQELQDSDAIYDLVAEVTGYTPPLDVMPWQPILRQRQAEAAEREHPEEIKWRYYKANVLDKYINHKYIHIGYDKDYDSHFIRFLNTDSSKPSQSRVNFRFVNQELLMVPVLDTLGIPPRQRAHWGQHLMLESELSRPTKSQ